jgi:hypothetical protein
MCNFYPTPDSVGSPCKSHQSANHSDIDPDPKNRLPSKEANLLLKTGPGMDRFRWILLLTTGMLTIVSARPYAGSWNDGSRLAAIESLADHHSPIIDESIFVKVPTGLKPYSIDQPNLNDKGTLDKLLIKGHFYSDKPYPISHLLGWLYSGLQLIGVPRFAEDPAPAIRILTILTSGLGYVVAVLSMDLVFVLLGMTRSQRITLSLTFAFSTVAPAYTRHLNSHAMFLGIAGLLTLFLVKESLQSNKFRWIPIGLCTGIGVLLDPGIGPALFLAMFIGSIVFNHSWQATALFLLSSLPWICWFMAENYQLGGVLGPINAVPEYLAWPDSPFNLGNLTGVSRSSPGKTIVYSLDLLFGKYGFLFHNLPCLLALIGFLPLMRKEKPVRTLILICFGWILGGWLVYSILSTNFSGASCSIRWFVPFLPSLFLILALFVRLRPRREAELRVLGSGGMVLGLIMWLGGPWRLQMVPGYWPIVAITILCWIWVHYGTRVENAQPSHPENMDRP